jgi:hypothetical protein
MVSLQRDMRDSRTAIAGGNKTTPQKAISLFCLVESDRKILRESLNQKYYSLEFSLSGASSAGMPDASSVNVLLVTAFLLELADKADGFIGRAGTVLGDDVDQRAFDVLRHSLGVAADVNVCPFGKP